MCPDSGWICKLVSGKEDFDGSWKDGPFWARSIVRPKYLSAWNDQLDNVLLGSCKIKTIALLHRWEGEKR